MTKVVTVTGTDCYTLAAQYLGDATQFYRILAQNLSVLIVDGVVDFVISGPPITITIPDANNQSTGGLPSQ
jgi:hypothetical protein